MNRLVRTAIARPRAVIAVWVLIVAACVPLMLQLNGALKAGGFDNPRGSAAHGQRLLDGAFKEPPETLQVVLHNPSAAVTDSVDPVTRLARQFRDVASVADYRQNPQWLSADRHTTFVQLGYQVDATRIQAHISDLRKAIQAALSGTGTQVNVTGAQALDYDLSVQSTQDASTAELIAFPLLFIVLLLVFRSVASMLVPVIIAAMALVIAMAIGYLLTLVMSVSILFENAVSIIGLAVSVDYSLFIIKRYRDELAAGGDYVESLQTAVRTAGRSVLFSGLAVVVALVALFIPRIMVFTSIALAGIVVTLVAIAMSMTLLPAVLRLLGRRINWGSIRSGRTRQSAGLPRPVTWLLRRPIALLLVLVPLFAALSVPVSAIRLQAAVASASILPPSADSRKGIERLRSDLRFQDLFPVQIALSAPRSAGPGRLLDSVASAAKVAQGQQHVANVAAVTGLGIPAQGLTAAADGDVSALPAQAGTAFSQLWTVSGDRYVSRVVIVAATPPDSDATHDLVRALRDKLPAATGSGTTVQVTGVTAGGVDFDDVLLASLPAILATVAVITMALLTRAFRSWLLPLLALLLNAMVVAASLGLLTLISQVMRGQRIDSITPTLVFAVMFGLSMDYMVIMISRMRERYLENGDHREAVTEGMRRTAGLVNGAALIMVAVFVSFLSAKISVVQQLGLALAIAVILDAVVIRLLVMPAALYLVGPRAWGRTARVARAATAGTPYSGLVEEEIT